MGCGSSKRTLETVDDSVHVMLAHDKKVAAKKGQAPSAGYKPRAEHPLLHQQAVAPPVAGNGNDASGGAGNASGGTAAASRAAPAAVTSSEP